MPFFDLNNFSKIEDKKYDFSIVGAGAAGILLAVKLSKKGFKVLLIESGNFSEDIERQKLNEVNHTAKYLNTAIFGRRRAVGGTTIAWGGQSLPFEKIDFEKRDWINNSGWPIDYNEVSKYYNDANEFMGVDKFDYNQEMLKLLKLNHTDLTNEALYYHVSKWSNEPNFAKANYNYLESNVDLYYNANLLDINYSTQLKQISTIVICNFKQQKFILPVGKVIVCTGGIESTRILLLSKIPSSSWLGKSFMEHPSIECGTIIPQNKYDFQKLFNTQFYKGKKYSLRLSLTAKEQHRSKLLNASASIIFKNKANDQGDVIDPYKELKMFAKDFKINRLSVIFKAIPVFAKTFKSIVFDGFIYKPNTIAKLTLMTEQSPSVESFIVLSDEPDVLGMRKAAVNWDIDDLVWRTIVVTSEEVKKIIEDKKLGDVHLYSHISYPLPNFETYLSGVNHHMGGTKMSDSFEEGVVDKNLKVWHCDNLYICSSSVFPTSSHSNPTLTIMALTCRLADHLEKSSNPLS